MDKRLKSAFLLVALSLFILTATAFLYPTFLGYLHLPNHRELSWDPVFHYWDGYRLSLHLRRLDLISFAYDFINMGFWLPFHPMIVCLISLFLPGQVEAVVLSNDLFLIFGSVFLIFLVSESSSKKNGEDSVPWLGLLLLGLICAWTASPTFVSLLNNVMLEVPTTVVAMIFFVSGAQYVAQRRLKDLRRALWALLALFMTKFHYGILTAPALFFFLPAPGVSRAELFRFLKLNVKKPLYAIMTALYFGVIALLLWKTLSGAEEFHIGSQRVSMRGYMNGIWYLLWAPLFLWSWELWRKRNFASRKLRPEWKSLERILIIPFSWYYLFPFRHKLGAFGHNLRYGEAKAMTFSQKAAFYPESLVHDFLGPWAMGSLCAVIILGAAFSFFSAKANRDDRRRHLFMAAGIGIFYVLMSFFNHNKEPRMLVTWMANWVAWSLVSIQICVLSVDAPKALWLKKFGIFLLAACTALGMGWAAKNSLALTERAMNWTRSSYLPSNYLGLDPALSQFDPKKPGIFYGMDLDWGAPLVSLKILSQAPSETSVFAFKRRHLWINDFGVEGNNDPLSFIEDKIRNHSVRQLVLMKRRFSPQELSRVEDTLSVAIGHPSRRLFDTPEYVFFAE